MLRIRWVHEREPRWNNTSGSPFPQTRHTIEQSRDGVRTLRAVRAMASRTAAGSPPATRKGLSLDMLGLCILGSCKLEGNWLRMAVVGAANLARTNAGVSPRARMAGI